MESFGKCALLISHPGHEIRVHGWLEKAKPVVYVLTDGSGRSGTSRLASTTRLLTTAGASAGSIYGRVSDRDFYELVLQRNLRFFRELTHELADELERGQFDFVLGDASEGEILTHDLWRGVIDAAVATAEDRLGRVIANYQFALEGPPQPSTQTSTNPVTSLVLDDAALARKMAAAWSYPELNCEVEQTLVAYGEEAFRHECLECAAPQGAMSAAATSRYERHGEALVAAGIYREAVRYEQHVAPILDDLQRPRRVAA
jgi:hypothetical protein